MCSRFITFLFNNDKKRYFKYASLQSKSAALILTKQALTKQDISLDTIVYIENSKVYYKSEAVLRIMFHLGGLFKVISMTISIIPNSVLDFIYIKIANNRYKISGPADLCRTPRPEEKEYFLD